MSQSDSATEQTRLTEQSGFVVLEKHCLVGMGGNDRTKQLHGFCTADINAIQPDHAAEAFVLNEKGKVLGYVHVVNRTDELLLVGHGDQSDALISHLDKYVLREDVTFEDKSQTSVAVFVTGKSAGEKLSKKFGETLAENEFRTISLENESQFSLGHVEIAGWGYLAVLSRSDLEAFRAILSELEIPECSLESLNAIRIEAGTPWFGLDVDDSNLPQELQRDDKTISFEKGCYLGQETVARIDSLGRVNQLLVKFTLEEKVTVPHDLVVDEKPAGRITSIAYHEKTGAWIGLGFVRRKHNVAGTKLGIATVR